MLRNEFYYVSALQLSGDILTCHIAFHPGHVIFSGHFPGQPVVPGVCMMEIVKELLEEHLGYLSLTAAGSVKFLRLLTPGMHANVHINWQQRDDAVQVTARFDTEDAPAFKMSATYKRQAG